MITKIRNFFVGAFEELKKVVWPNRQEVTSHTVIVVVSIVVSMGIVIAVDYAFFSLLQYFVFNR